MTLHVSKLSPFRILMFFIILGYVAFISDSVQAADVSIKKFSPDINDKEALQRGAAMFMNYCSGCHALKYMRYNRMAKDLGLLTFDGSIDNDLLYNNLILTTAKAHDPIQISMSPEDSRQWFGITPPDLSLKIRERGASWVYTYLTTFYADPKRPFGSNNLLVPDVSMPDVLMPLRGIVERENQNLVLIEKGDMSIGELNQSIADLVTFLTYVSEPLKTERYRIGFFVLPYLFLWLVIVYLRFRQIKKSITSIEI